VLTTDAKETVAKLLLGQLPGDAEERLEILAYMLGTEGAKVHDDTFEQCVTATVVTREAMRIKAALAAVK
jgi:hypothetical protein